MSFAQTTQSQPADESPDAYLLSLAPQNSTARFIYNKSTGKKTVVEGSAATNQVLYVASPSTGDYADPDVARWGNVGDIVGLHNKGDILTSNGTTIAVLPVGTNGQALVANSAMPDGLQWATIGGGGAGVTSIAASPLGGVNTGGSGLSFSVSPITTTGTIGLAASGVAAGVYPSDATKKVPSITVDAAGRITTATEAAIAPITISTPVNLTGGAALSPGSATTLDLADTAVTPGSYGTGAAVPLITVDQKGRITAAASTAISAITVNTTTPILGGASVVPGGTISLTHANTAVIPGAYGSAASALIPTITVDQKGHVTAASQTVLPSQGVAGDGIYITGGGSVLGVNPGITLTLANSGVTAGSYGSSTSVGTFTVDAKGRVTAASNVAIAGSSLGSITVNAASTLGNLTVSGSPVSLGGSITITDTALDSYPTRNWRAGTGSSITGGQTDSIAIGQSAAASGFSVAVGSGSGGNAMVQSVVMGYLAGSNSPSGSLVSIGYNSGKGLGASNSVFVGHSAGIGCRGVGNVFIGPAAGQSCTSGSANMAIGNGADVAATATNCNAIGNGVLNTTSGTTLIGDGTVSSASHVVKSTGYLKSTSQVGSAAGRISTDATQTIASGATATVSIFSTRYADGGATVNDSTVALPLTSTILLPDISYHYSASSLVTFSIPAISNNTSVVLTLQWSSDGGATWQTLGTNMWWFSNGSLTGGVTCSTSMKTTTPGTNLIRAQIQNGTTQTLTITLYRLATDRSN